MLYIWSPYNTTLNVLLGEEVRVYSGWIGKRVSIRRQHHCRGYDAAAQLLRVQCCEIEMTR